MRAAGAAFPKYAQAPQNRGSYGGVLLNDDNEVDIPEHSIPCRFSNFQRWF
jgi:hypothetical protein